MAPPILVQDLTRTFRSLRRKDTVVAVSGLSLEVGAGEVFALLGPNGSGKSTTMKVLLGLLRPTQGRVLLLGHPAGHRPTLRRVGYLPEETRLFEFLTGRETVRFFGALAGLSRREAAARADRLLDELDLEDAAGRRVGGYSKGMTRRLGLAAALVGEPEVLILDEPTSGLDPLAAAGVKERIRTLKEAGCTVLLSSHLLSDVEDLCDRIAVLGKGRLISEGDAGELLTLRDEFELRFRSGDPELPAKIRDLALSSGAESAEVCPAREDLESLFLRIFRKP